MLIIKFPFVDVTFADDVVPFPAVVGQIATVVVLPVVQEEFVGEVDELDSALRSAYMAL
jgi:hypothetical protein